MTKPPYSKQEMLDFARSAARFAQEWDGHAHGSGNRGRDLAYSLIALKLRELGVAYERASSIG